MAMRAHKLKATSQIVRRRFGLGNVTTASRTDIKPSQDLASISSHLFLFLACASLSSQPSLSSHLDLISKEATRAIKPRIRLTRAELYRQNKPQTGRASRSLERTLRILPSHLLASRDSSPAIQEPWQAFRLVLIGLLRISSRSLALKSLALASNQANGCLPKLSYLLVLVGVLAALG